MPEYDAQTALIVVDVQNDFADPKGSLYVHGAERLVPAINAEIEAARKAGALVVYSQDWHPAHTPHFAQDGGQWPVHCVASSWGAAFHPQLRVVGEPIRKGSGGEDGYSGFSLRDAEGGERRDTKLVALLQSHKIRRVIVVGLATDYCVKETGFDAVRLGFDTTVLRHAVGAVNLNSGDGERALAELQAAGVNVE